MEAGQQWLHIKMYSHVLCTTLCVFCYMKGERFVLLANHMCSIAQPLHSSPADSLWLTYLAQAVCDHEGRQPRWRPVHCTSPGWSLRFPQTWGTRACNFWSWGTAFALSPDNWKETLCTDSSSLNSVPRSIVAVQICTIDWDIQWSCGILFQVTLHCTKTWDISLTSQWLWSIW